MRQRPGRRNLVKKPSSALWHLGLSGFVVAGAIAIALYSLWHDRPQPQSALAPASSLPALAQARDGLHFADVFYSDIDYALEELGLWPALVRKERHSDVDRVEIKVPADLPLAEVNLALTLAARARGGRVLSAVETVAGKRVEMRFAFGKTPTTAVKLARTAERRRTGRIAIVLDDLGRDSPLVERFCALQQSLTLALLPNTGPVRAIAERARQNGHQVIVHLPMEPIDYPAQDPGAGAVLIRQNEQEIRQIVRNALQQVPTAAGFNNHMGSKATADERVMRIVLQEVRAQGLFFLDSRTTPKSLAYSLARDMGVKALRRDAFIDEIDELQAIETKLWDLAKMAGRTGAVIAIGHDRENTLLALESVLPRLETRGFRFAALDQLLP